MTPKEPAVRFSYSHNGKPLSVADTEAAISKQREYMKQREISHDLYHSDPYGYQHDVSYLRQLIEWRDYMKANQNEQLLDHTLAAVGRVVGVQNNQSAETEKEPSNEKQKTNPHA